MITIFIQVKGIVQGVGFRPFVYNLALKHNIKGWVNNDDRGVNIILYSSKKNCQDFIDELQKNPPKLSQIEEIQIEEIDFCEDFKSFEIKESQTNNNKSTIISSDIAICEDCKADIDDIDNFRYFYPLTNCINCGPRYSIIKTIPYDRCNTSMDKFELCEKCQEEYKNPLNRRYHAQPICCSQCGPKVVLYNNQNQALKSNIDAIKQTVELIKEGYIVAIKGMGGFHIVCDSLNDATIKELRIRKNRPSKPFAVLFQDLESIKNQTILNEKELEVINSKEKPIVLLKKSKNYNLSSLIAPNIDILGCFISYTPLHHLLFKYLNNPLIATSANLKDEPIIISKDEILEKLSLIVDFVLDFDRDIINGCDDSIVQVIKNDVFVLRNARGYAPSFLRLNESRATNILSFGANQKSTISLSFEKNIFLSPYIGDLNSIESIKYFSKTIKTFERFYDFKPNILICDKHPNYESTKYAKELEKENPNIKLIQIQHHYAHILSVMAEHNLDEEVLGFAFDGTGFGDDGNIWGGEVFIASRNEYKRVHHLNYFKLLGGEMAIKEPKRVALSLLFDNFGLEEILNLDISTIKAFTIQEIKNLYLMHQKDLNAPKTSSIGRLFDAVSSLANILHNQSYEGETGLLMESFYDKNIEDSYGYILKEDIIDISLMIKEIVKDGENRVLISSKFINTIVNMIWDISTKYPKFPVAISGGVFQNRVLMEKLIEKFKRENKTIYFNKKIPSNDSGISVGQNYIREKN